MATNQEFTTRATATIAPDPAIATEGAGPVVICLHGFPDSPWTFSGQATALSDAGYRVIAPYLRGYHPQNMAVDGDYSVAAAAADLIGLIDTLGEQNVVLLGHDWGAAIANAVALRAPQKVHALITVAVPHGPGLMQALFNNPAQQRRSWYVFFFQTAFAEAAVGANLRQFVEQIWRDWSPGWRFSDEILDQAVDTLAAPGVLSAALGYYRAMLGAAPPAETPKLSRPALYLHGADDGCIGAECCAGMEAFYTGPFEQRIVPGVGHFLHREAPQRVSEIILEWLATLAQGAAR